MPIQEITAYSTAQIHIAALRGHFFISYTLCLWMHKPVHPTANLSALLYGQRFISLRSSLVSVLESTDAMKDKCVTQRSKKLMPEKSRFDPGTQVDPSNSWISGWLKMGWIHTWKAVLPSGKCSARAQEGLPSVSSDFCIIKHFLRKTIP